MISRGVVKTFTAVARGFNKVSVALLSDDPSDVQHFTIHGLASHPQAGAPLLAVQPAGNADHIVALVSGQGPALEAGASALYNDFSWTLALLSDRLRLTHSGTERLVVTDSAIVLGTSGLLPIVRDGDIVTFDADFLTWAEAVRAAVAPTTLPATPSTGTVAASSTKVTAE